ncbi:hypothetical protein [Sphingomonas jaspsi]|uniref:hypothetical protein n=1 Tax=Sphingomonas jaspsi TaxID=392409 RepID=UPI0004B5091B|nr:hypothetical protein [Sphingomonas jaspsi]
MSVRIDPRLLADAREIVIAPDAPRAVTERDFNLPVALHAGFFGLFIAYLGVMWIGFGNPDLAIPMAIFLFFTAAFYVVPALWATMAGPSETRAMPLDKLLGSGIDTLTGRTGGGAAVAQVLVLPVLIFLWGVAVAVIAALV